METSEGITAITPKQLGWISLLSMSVYAFLATVILATLWPGSQEILGKTVPDFARYEAIGYGPLGLVLGMVSVIVFAIRSWLTGFLIGYLTKKVPIRFFGLYVYAVLFVVLLVYTVYCFQTRPDSVRLLAVWDRAEECEAFVSREGRDSCFSQVAYHTEDILLCEKIRDDETRYGCISNTPDTDPGACMRIPETSPTKESCLQRRASATMDASECASFRDEARDVCFLQSEQCDKVANTSALIKALCVMRVITRTPDAAMCEQISDGLRKDYRDRCFSTAADRTGNASMCMKIMDERTRAGCLSGIAYNSHDSALCMKITDLVERDYCLVRLAEGTRQLPLCSEVVTPEYQDTCRDNVFLQTGDCANVKDSSRRRDCEKMRDAPVLPL